MREKTASIRREKIIIPTYKTAAPEELPVFFKFRNNQGTHGRIYPYRMSDRLLREKSDAEYDAVILENDFLRVTVLPQLGGRIYEGYDKINNYNFVYKNSVIKPALIGLCGLWISGGIEFNWPQHHRPTTFMPVECVIRENPDGSKTAWVGETESMYGLKSAVGVTVYPDKSYIEANVKLFNGTPQTQAFHWWANLAVHANDDYRLVFPPDIDYVTNHNRTEVADFPIVSGKYGGADFGGGVDIRNYNNLYPAGSFFVFNSEYSFMAGYDCGKKMGTVHIADRHISPGKKFFGWGNADYGTAWQKNLTDDDGPYLEIMTGCYTDNQPDFAWINPFETKDFTQRWYPVCGIQELKNASERGAVGYELIENGLRIIFNVTSPHEKVMLRALHNNNELSCNGFSVEPGFVYSTEINLNDLSADDIEIILTDENGGEIISYKKIPFYFDDKKKPEPRLAAKSPEEIESAEELWINGMHIEQYKHPYMRPDPYYAEALKRDPYDSRCNIAMAVLNYKRGLYEEALPYLEKAIERLTNRNPNPYDSEAYYQAGMVYRQLGLDKKAIDNLKKAAWNYAWRSAALQTAAEIEVSLYDYDAALRDAEKSLETNKMNQRASALKIIILIKKNQFEAAERLCREAIENDPLDAQALFLYGYLYKNSGNGYKSSAVYRDLKNIAGDKTTIWLGLAELFIRSGFYGAVHEVLALPEKPSPMLAFYKSYIYGESGDVLNEEKSLTEVENGNDDVFPNSDLDYIILSRASRAENKNAAAAAHYYLGCMDYHRGNGERALKHWQDALIKNPSHREARRCLAHALFETLGDYDAANKELSRAFEAKKTPRMLFELYQLRRVSGAPPEENLKLIEENIELAYEREDLVIQYVTLLCAAGKLYEAAKILEGRDFYTYEGGEGALLRLHSFVYIALGRNEMQNKNFDAALNYFLKALECPPNYNEGKRHRPNESHVHWHISKAYECIGDAVKRSEHLSKSDESNAEIEATEYFRGLTKRGLGDYSGAAEIFNNLVSEGKRLINKQAFDYFGGFRITLPFEQDEKRILREKGLNALIYGYAGLGQKIRAAEAHRELIENGYDALWAGLILNDGSLGELIF